MTSLELAGLLWALDGHAERDRAEDALAAFDSIRAHAILGHDGDCVGAPQQCALCTRDHFVGLANRWRALAADGEPDVAALLGLIERAAEVEAAARELLDLVGGDPAPEHDGGNGAARPLPHDELVRRLEGHATAELAAIKRLRAALARKP